MPHERHPLVDPFDGIDIYLFDQLLKRRIGAGMRVLDAGCGTGRNAVVLSRVGCEVYAVDTSAADLAAALERVRAAEEGIDARRFRVESADSLTFDDASFDVVLAVAVLHFARDGVHFQRMLDELWRVLKAGGIFFARLASSIGIEDRIVPLGANRFRLPDGSERYLVDEADVVNATERLGGELLDPLKTTNVQGRRAMTTWCMRKR